jgi:hypothetical protein
MPIAQVLERADPEQLAIATEAVQRDRWIEQPAHVEGEDILWRALRAHVGPMAGQQCTDIGRPRVVGGNQVVGHQNKLRDRVASP